MLSVILIGISLSMDAFAVSVTNGIAMRPFKTGYALWHGLYFGAFQFLMPLAGYILGSTVSGYVTAIGPYVSFALLAFIGGKMILEAVRGGEEGSGGMAALSHKRLLALAVATSIDALAVGVSFAFSPPGPGVVLSCAVIGWHNVPHRLRRRHGREPHPRHPPENGGDRRRHHSGRHRSKAAARRSAQIIIPSFAVLVKAKSAPGFLSGKSGALFSASALKLVQPFCTVSRFSVSPSVLS